MIDARRLFHKYSNPLREVTSPEPGEVYYDLRGHAFKCISKDEFQLVKGSPLVEDEVVTDLTPKQLKLFWTIVKNNNIYDTNIE